jgi:hypothetical protein
MGVRFMQLATKTQTGDDSLRALLLILAAWEEGEEDGVPPEMMAYAAIYTALTDLVSLFGEEAVATLARGLERRVRQGEFSGSGDLH